MAEATGMLQALQPDGSTTTDETTQFGTIEVAEGFAERASDVQLVALLISEGASRLTAARMVEIYRGNAEPGRARPHPGRGYGVRSS